jgi:DNA-binding PucR family transcriptional regulator
VSVRFDHRRFQLAGKAAVDIELLLQELAQGAALEPFRALIEPLREHDRTRRSDLVQTLKTYFSAGGNASEAADRLYLHRNSMLYRLERIQKLTGLDLKDDRVALALRLGLLANERGDRDATEHP